MKTRCNNFYYFIRGVATAGGTGSLLPPTPRLKLSVSNIRDIAFYGCSEVIRTRNFTIFTVYATIFGQFTAVFIFSNYTGEIDHFTLDLLKRSNT